MGRGRGGVALISTVFPRRDIHSILWVLMWHSMWTTFSPWVQNMGFRRQKADVAAQRQWKQFVDRHLPQIARIGIPEVIMQSREHWIDFLMHARFHDDPSYFHSWNLPPETIEAFIELLAAYFNEGYPYCDVTALGHQNYRDELQRRLGRSGGKKP